MPGALLLEFHFNVFEPGCQRRHHTRASFEVACHRSELQSLRLPFRAGK
jgi:hypothetical protein